MAGVENRVHCHLGIAAITLSYPLGDCCNLLHTLAHGKLKGKNGQHFVLLPIGIKPTKT